MKKLAESNGAELAPISVTGGMSAGRGVVSMRVAWLNLQLRNVSKAGGGASMLMELAYTGFRPDILMLGVSDGIDGRRN